MPGAWQCRSLMQSSWSLCSKPAPCTNLHQSSRTGSSSDCCSSRQRQKMALRRVRFQSVGPRNQQLQIAAMHPSGPAAVTDSTAAGMLTSVGAAAPTGQGAGVRLAQTATLPSGSSSGSSRWCTGPSGRSGTSGVSRAVACCRHRSGLSCRTAICMADNI